MTTRSSAIDVVEAGYRLEGTETEWFDRVLERLVPELACGLGTMAITYRFAGERVVLDRVVGFDCPPEIVAFTRAIYENVPPEAARAMRSGPGNLSTFSEFTQSLPREEREQFQAATAAIGIRDCLVVGHPDGDGDWIAFAACTAGSLPAFPSQRHMWRKMFAHVATAWRLRRRVGSAGAVVEAVMSRSGRVLSASGEAASRPSRERLAQATKAIRTARGPLRLRDPMAAMDLWKGLVSGRWSLVDRVDTDGKTLLVAHENAPQATDPRGLTARERAIVELVLTGASNKEIGYTLGLGTGTVASYLREGMAKLGFEKRVDLMRLASLGDATAPRATTGDSELGVLVLEREKRGEQLPLTTAERAVATLAVEGLSNAEIATRRGSSERTVANQLARIYEKLGIGSRAELVLALSRG